MAHAKHDNLWAVTTGQRARYSGAIVAMAVANICMFGAPLIAKYAIDVVVAKDVTLGTPMLVGPAAVARADIRSQNAFAWYLLAVGRACGCGDRRRRRLPVRARPLVGDCVRSDRAPLARDAVSPPARSARAATTTTPIPATSCSVAAPTSRRCACSCRATSSRSVARYC